MNEIDNKDLNRINGGGLEGTDDLSNIVIKGKKITIYETADYIGKEIYVKNQGTYASIYAGKLNSSIEGPAYRTINITIRYGTDAGKTTDKYLYNDLQNGHTEVWLVEGYKGSSFDLHQLR